MPCSVCGRAFVPRFAYQSARGPEGEPAHFCSVACRAGPGPRERSRPAATCSTCGTRFQVQYALQTIEASVGAEVERTHVCSEACRVARLQAGLSGASATRVIAVLNQKGGTGKTTTSVALAAGLASLGRRVLLVDADAQGNVAVSLGLSSPRGLYHVMVEGVSPLTAAVAARENLWAVLADRTLSSAGPALSSAPDPWRVMAQAFATIGDRFDYVVIDCAPSVSLIGHNALAFARELIVPVSCDFLALVGVKQVLRTVRHINETLQHPVRVLGVLPTFFDLRNRICRQSVDALRSYFGDRVMPPVRIGTAFKEAPSLGRTIFEHAPKGRGAKDYREVVDWVEAGGPAAVEPDDEGDSGPAPPLDRASAAPEDRLSVLTSDA